MTADEKYDLITRNLEEVLTAEELKALIASDVPLKHYIGFEISGKVHLGQGIFSMRKVKDIHDAGAETVIWLADWHSWINNKLDGTLETAQRLAREYFAEALKAGYMCIGGNPDDLIFKQGSDLYLEHPEFWVKVVKVAKATTISRMMRSTDIMGRLAGESSNAATLFYPAMQAADIFQMEINLAHAGTDQRNVHVVARDAAKEMGMAKPVALHHHLIQGLLPPVLKTDEKGNKVMDMEATKMSKSKPDSAIFITDSPDEIKRKIKGAYCPEGIVEFNPILDWVKHLILALQGQALQIQREEKFGGDITYSNYEDLEKDYKEKKLHPMDLKNAVAEWLIKKLEPARIYFEDPKRKSALEEIERLTQG